MSRVFVMIAANFSVFRRLVAKTNPIRYLIEENRLSSVCLTQSALNIRFPSHKYLPTTINNNHLDKLLGTGQDVGAAGRGALTRRDCPGTRVGPGTRGTGGTRARRAGPEGHATGPVARPEGPAINGLTN